MGAIVTSLEIQMRGVEQAVQGMNRVAQASRQASREASTLGTSYEESGFSGGAARKFKGKAIALAGMVGSEMGLGGIGAEAANTAAFSAFYGAIGAGVGGILAFTHTLKLCEEAANDWNDSVLKTGLGDRKTDFQMFRDSWLDTVDSLMGKEGILTKEMKNETAGYGNGAVNFADNLIQKKLRERISKEASHKQNALDDLSDWLEKQPKPTNGQEVTSLKEAASRKYYDLESQYRIKSEKEEEKKRTDQFQNSIRKSIWFEEKTGVRGMNTLFGELYSAGKTGQFGGDLETQYQTFGHVYSAKEAERKKGIQEKRQGYSSLFEDLMRPKFAGIAVRGSAEEARALAESQAPLETQKQQLQILQQILNKLEQGTQLTVLDFGGK